MLVETVTCSCGVVGWSSDPVGTNISVLRDSCNTISRSITKMLLLVKEWNLVVHTCRCAGFGLGVLLYPLDDDPNDRHCCFVCTYSA